MIRGTGYSIRNMALSYRRYGLHIAKKTEVNREFTDRDDYKQKMMEKYLNRSSEIKNTGLYSIIRSAGGRTHVVYDRLIQKEDADVANSEMVKNEKASEDNIRQIRKEESGAFTKPHEKKDNPERLETEALKLERQRILNDMARAGGDTSKWYDLNVRLSMVEHQLRTKNNGKALPIA